MSYQRGDVVWGPDPFRSGGNPRPWLILNNDRHPFGDEEYMTVTLTTTVIDSFRESTVPLSEAEKEAIQRGRISSGTEADEADDDEILY